MMGFARHYKRLYMKGGFTLIELLVVLIIISLVSAFVAPRIIAPFSNLHLKTAAQEIAGTLRYNRSQAVSEKVERVAVFDLDGRSVRIFSADNSIVDTAGDTPEKKPADTIYELPDGVGFEKATAGEEEFEEGEFAVAFFPNGSSSGGDVVLSGESGRRLGIEVNAITGIVRVSELERDG